MSEYRIYALDDDGNKISDNEANFILITYTHIYKCEDTFGTIITIVAVVVIIIVKIGKKTSERKESVNLKSVCVVINNYIYIFKSNKV